MSKSAHWIGSLGNEGNDLPYLLGIRPQNTHAALTQVKQFTHDIIVFIFSLVYANTPTLSFGLGGGDLLGLAVGLPCETGAGASLAGVGLLGEGLLLGLLGLHAVDLLDEDALVLEVVALGEHVEGVVDVLVDLLGVAHLLEEAAEDADAAHPQDLLGETGVGGTTALTGACSNAMNKNASTKYV